MRTAAHKAYFYLHLISWLEIALPECLLHGVVNHFCFVKVNYALRLAGYLLIQSVRDNLLKSVFLNQ